MADARGRPRDLETARSAVEHRRGFERLSGDLTRTEIIEVLRGLHFDRGAHHVRCIEVDAEARDFLVGVLLR